MRLRPLPTLLICTLVSTCFLASCKDKAIVQQVATPPSSVALFSAPAIAQPDPTIDAGKVFTQAATEPIRFSTQGIGVAVTKRQTPALSLIRSVQSNNKACSTITPADTFTKLNETYAKAKATSYVITTVRDSSSYIVTVIPNLIKATDIAAAQRDFPSCTPNVGYHVFKVSPSQIIFKTPCLPIDAGCEAIAKKVDASLAVK